MPTAEASSSFRACGIIPVYDHPKTVGHVAERLLAHVNHVIIVDDGSGAVARQAIDALSRRSGIQVHRRPHNGGKGKAVKDGLRLAKELGFTHALQVDADAQHDLTDVPRFLEAAARTPSALILGAPLFDASAPSVRRRARQLTTFWTSVETGGRSITDPMCGFRVYPVEAALSANARGDRMDFDPEVAVRMVWAGVPVINLKTRVRYLTPQQGGVSHFRLLRDNLRISWMHTRLVSAAIFRHLTRLVRGRRSPNRPQQPWHEIPEAGNRWGIRFLVLLCRRLGRAPARFLLLFIVAYYLVSRPQARRASRDYLARMGTRADLKRVYQHLLRFAQCSLDRFFLLAGDVGRFQVTHQGREHLTELGRRGRGALLLGAHLGSFEALRALGKSANVEVVAVGYFDNADKVNRELDGAGDNRSQRFVNVVPGDLQYVFRLKESIERGQFVAMLADRCLTEPGVAVDFLGSAARFPIAPYALAAALECPVFLTLGLYTSPNRYTLLCEPLWNRVPKRSEQPDAFLQCARVFAHRLEEYCRRVPDNWFNFYDFWASAAASPAAPARTRGSARSSVSL